MLVVQGNLGWALMHQSNYIEAEEDYRRALLLAPDNNKMCNLGICLMKQGRIREAKENLRRVKLAVADGPRGINSHLNHFRLDPPPIRQVPNITAAEYYFFNYPILEKVFSVSFRCLMKKDERELRRLRGGGSRRSQKSSDGTDSTTSFRPRPRRR